jgi:hypothetical protein
MEGDIGRIFECRWVNLTVSCRIYGSLTMFGCNHNESVVQDVLRLEFGNNLPKREIDEVKRLQYSGGEWIAGSIEVSDRLLSHIDCTATLKSKKCYCHDLYPPL